MFTFASTQYIIIPQSDTFRFLVDIHLLGIEIRTVFSNLMSAEGGIYNASDHYHHHNSIRCLSLGHEVMHVHQQEQSNRHVNIQSYALNDWCLLQLLKIVPGDSPEVCPETGSIHRPLYGHHRHLIVYF